MLFFFNGFDYNEFRKISTYESAKRKKMIWELWRLLMRELIL